MSKLLLALFVSIPFFSWASFDPIQEEGSYQVQLDLTTIKNDRIKVEVVVPILGLDELIYQMPVMVPGTYKIYNFGQFVNNLVAINSFGDTLVVEKLNQNQWKIKEASSLYKIIYWADDSYDKKGLDLFAPAGTNISDKVFLFLG